MFGIRNIVNFFKPEPPPPPPPPPKPEPQPAVNADARTFEQQQIGLNLKNKLARFVPEEPAPKPLTPDEQARQAAKEVEQAYNDHPNVIISAPGHGRDPNELSAQAAAAQKLREVTATQTPEVAALTIKYAQPTIDRIAFELGKTAKDNDGGYGDSKPKFDTVISDHAAAANRAAPAPEGKAVVEQMAKSLVNFINKDDIGRFDEAFGKPVGDGTGRELTAAFIKQLQAAGRTDQADDVLQNVQDGINQLHDRAEDVAEKVGKYNEELSWLVQQWKPLMSEEQLNSAIQAYKDKNPEYVEGLKEMDEIAVSTLRAIDTFGNTKADFAGLGHADDVENSLKDLLNDDKTKAILAQSTSAVGEIERLMQKADNNPDAANFFDQVTSVAGKVDDAKFLHETILNKALDATIENSFNAATAKNYDEVSRQLGRLEKYADKLGYNDRDFRNVIQQLGRVSRATSQQEVETDLRVLARKIESYQRTNPDVFTNENQFADKFKRFGLVLGAVGTASSIYQAGRDPNTLNIAGALTDAAGLTTDVAQTKLITNLLENKAWFKGLPLEALGKVFGGLSLALDAIGVIQSIQKGDYVDAGLGTASAVGGAMMIFGGAAVTGVGAVVVGAAIIGKLIYDHVQEANKHESDGARAFLQGAGINADLANQLINNDDDGRSPAPVFTAMAEHLGIDPKDYFEYLAKLPPDKAKNLMETAHGVDPDDKGVYPVEKQNPAYGAGKGGYYVSKSPNDLTDLTNWMRENGYADAPGL